jgi:dienelactone hydrolase
MHYAGLKPGEVMGVVNFSGGWYPYGPVTTPYYANAGRGAADKVPQLWLYADNDNLYPEALIREYYQAFTAAGGRVHFELLHGVPGAAICCGFNPVDGDRSRTNSWLRLIAGALDPLNPEFG